MPSGYNEIPGVYTPSPRPLASVRRNLRSYKWCLGATSCVVVVITLATLISFLIGTNVDDLEEGIDRQDGSQMESDPQNRTLHTLLNLTWPRRDEIWYKKRWSRTHMKCPFSARNSSKMPPCYHTRTLRVQREVEDQSDEEFLRNHLLSNPFDSISNELYVDDEGEDEDYTTMDGSTFPSNDTFYWNRNATQLPDCSIKKIGDAWSRSSDTEATRLELEDELESRNISLKRNSPSFYHQKAFRKTSPKALELSRQGFRIDHASKEICRMLDLNKEDSTFDSIWLGDLNESPYCDFPRPELKCSRHDRFRSIDGTCNNLGHPYWGASNTEFRRLMPPDYADGILEPRKAKSGNELPSPRTVSRKVHSYRRVHSESYTLLTMTWGQFIDHDITATAQTKGKNGEPISCCHKEVINNRTLSHPECLEIQMTDDDEFYMSKNVSCMEFLRSAPAPRCNFGPRNQLNQNTHFLDGSVIYGSTPEQLSELRAYKEGLLKTQITIDGRQLMQPSLNPNDSCNTAQQMYWKQHCFISGDSRVNEHILLTILHTVWTQQHNYIAEELRDVNPDWSDERLFQESRKIVIAQIQHITYHEYLPSIIGPHLSYGLNLSPSFGEYFEGYDSKIHPGLANGFAAAAFRFGHSMIQGLIQSIDASGANVKFDQLKKYFFNPFTLYDPKTIGDMIRGEVSQRAAAVDSYFTTQVTNRLFQTPGNKHGLDLVSINVQRGRDHGIPSYTRWRMMCGLPPVTNFTDLASDMDSEALKTLEDTYEDVDDVDLYSGGLAEIPVMDGLVGPTFACVITDQFIRLKRGDRFWYENGPKFNSFTKEQLKEIRKTTLSRVLCNNIGELGSIQHWPLRKFDTDNPRLPCSARTIPRMSLDPWEEGGF